MEVKVLELIGECDIALRSCIWKSNEDDDGGGVPCGEAMIARQLLTRPVALECAIDDNSNGLTARDLFNLKSY